MKKRPLAVTVIAVLLMAAGLMGMVGGIMNHTDMAAEHYAVIWIVAVNALAIVAGVFTLRGRNWARWLAVAWMAFHVAISLGDPMKILVPHAILLILFAYGLFRDEARAYFQSRSTLA